ncbi:MAG: VOC family protein [Ignavibacteria bacterium]
MKIPDNTKIQSVDLKVRDLRESLDFYSNLIGFRVIEEKGDTVLLSASGKPPYIIRLREVRDALRRQRGTSGLFHTAFRFPSRKELARVFLRLFDNKTKFTGFSDHLVSEAIYLNDPDENGVELYADRPKAGWHYSMGQVEMDTLPLDLSVITSELDDRNVWNGIHPETDIGHIHLSVSDLHKAQEIYSLLLGFNITNSSYPGALFMAAGGYHHHIGANTWLSKGGNPAPENSAGLEGFTVSIPDEKYMGIIKERADESKILTAQNGNNNFSFLDFDKNKITLTL